MDKPRVEMDILYPYRKDESPGDWTRRVLSHSGEHGVNRQCSIGWHGECSERDDGPDAECLCLCHAEGAKVYTVEGDIIDGHVVPLRSASGRQYWEEQEGDSPTMWAWWVIASDYSQAERQAVLKETNRRAERDVEWSSG